MTRTFFKLLACLPFAMTAATVAWIMTQSPFAAPLVERSIEQTRIAITRAMAREVTLAWLLPRVQVAILEEDVMQLALLLDLANDYGIALPRPMLDDIADIDRATSGFAARGSSCGACAVDINACQTLAQIGACALPFELTPAGDLNALRRAAVDYTSDTDIDRLDVGLAIIGLGATGALLATGGTSYSVKAGTSVLRLARRMGTLTPALAARLTDLVGGAVRWDRFGDLVRMQARPADLIDATKLSEVTDIGTSLRRVAAQTSVAETVSLLRYVDTTKDAARLARVSNAMGPKTRGAFEVLGKTRVMRAALRLSDLAITATIAIYALCLQVLLLAGQLCGTLCLRRARRIIQSSAI